MWDNSQVESEFFIANLLVRNPSIIVMIRWTGLAPWELEFPFPCSLTSTFLWVDTTQRATKGKYGHNKATCRYLILRNVPMVLSTIGSEEYPLPGYSRNSSEVLCV